MDAIAEILASGAFTRQQSTALRQLLGLIVAGDPAGTAATLIAAHEAEPDPHPDYLTEAEADLLYKAIDAAEWTYDILAADFDTTTTGTGTSTGLAFTPAISSNYEFEAILILRTSATGTGARPGVAWPTLLVDGVARAAIVGSTADTEIFKYGNMAAAFVADALALSSSSQSYMGRVSGTIITGATTTGDLAIRLASETGNSVTAKAGSFLRYRRLP